MRVIAISAFIVAVLFITWDYLVSTYVKIKVIVIDFRTLPAVAFVIIVYEAVTRAALIERLLNIAIPHWRWWQICHAFIDRLRTTIRGWMEQCKLWICNPRLVRCAKTAPFSWWLLVVALAVPLLFWLCGAIFALTTTPTTAAPRQLSHGVLLKSIPDCRALPRSDMADRLADSLLALSDDTFVILEGPLGSGKSTLAREVTETLRARDTHVWILTEQCTVLAMLEHLLSAANGLGSLIGLEEMQLLLRAPAPPFADILLETLRLALAASGGRPIVLVLDGCAYTPDEPASALALWTSRAVRTQLSHQHYSALRVLISCDPSPALYRDLQVAADARFSLGDIVQRSILATCTKEMLCTLFPGPAGCNDTLVAEVVAAYPSSFLLVRLFLSHAQRQPQLLDNPRASVMALHTLWAHVFEDLFSHEKAWLDLAILGTVGAVSAPETYISRPVIESSIRLTSVCAYRAADFADAYDRVAALLRSPGDDPVQLFHPSLTAYMESRDDGLLRDGHLRLALWTIAVGMRRESALARVKHACPPETCLLQQLAGMCRSTFGRVECRQLDPAAVFVPAALPDAVRGCLLVHHLAHSERLGALALKGKQGAITEQQLVSRLRSSWARPMCEPWGLQRRALSAGADRVCSPASLHWSQLPADRKLQLTDDVSRGALPLIGLAQLAAIRWSDLVWVAPLVECVVFLGPEQMDDEDWRRRLLRAVDSKLAPGPGLERRYPLVARSYCVSHVGLRDPASAQAMNAIFDGLGMAAAHDVHGTPLEGHIWRADVLAGDFVHIIAITKERLACERIEEKHEREACRRACKADVKIDPSSVTITPTNRTALDQRRIWTKDLLDQAMQAAAAHFRMHLRSHVNSTFHRYHVLG